MAEVAQLVLTFGLLPALVVGLRALERRMFGSPAPGRPPRRRPRRPAAAPAPGRRPLQVVAADVRRLSGQLSVVPAGAPLVRWQALWTAFDEVLVEAAEQLDVPHELACTPPGLARDLERLRVLAALEAAGLTVHY
ncbi:MAG: hypothetical protein ACLGI3_06775 [Actinomycetes bacterium]